MFNQNEQNLAWLKNGADLQTETYCWNWFCSSHFTPQGYNSQFYYGLWFGAQDSVIPSHIQEVLYRRVFMLEVCILFLWLRNRGSMCLQCLREWVSWRNYLRKYADRERWYHRLCSTLITREAANQWYFTCKEALVVELELNWSLLCAAQDAELSNLCPSSGPLRVTQKAEAEISFWLNVIL